ncbi:hypothetical protein MXD59_12630 [Frankia sp. Ag45/Mut15]|uniref:Uncharacterized protein n=1 Tax=Frankia umida TaxID=573489 RepID=A0ABT0JYJ2_9ACTN|nr:hypothetical protein [Frankia umida]MCK9876613.1 hypothetical protein [Frankia umida]
MTGHEPMPARMQHPTGPTEITWWDLPRPSEDHADLLLPAGQVDGMVYSENQRLLSVVVPHDEVMTGPTYAATSVGQLRKVLDGLPDGLILIAAYLPWDHYHDESARFVFVDCVGCTDGLIGSSTPTDATADEATAA